MWAGGLSHRETIRAVLKLQDSGLEGWGGLELLHVPGQKPRFRVWGLGKASWVPRGVPDRRKSPAHGSPSSALFTSFSHTSFLPRRPGTKAFMSVCEGLIPRGIGGWGGRKSQPQTRSPRKRNGGTYLPSAGRERPTCPPASGQQRVWASWAEAGSRIAASGPWREGGGQETEAGALVFTAGGNSPGLRRPQVREI